MDRDSFVRFLNNKTGLTVEEALKVIEDYCMAKNKPAEQIHMLIKLLVANINFITPFLQDAKLYFMQEYTIVRVEEPIPTGGHRVIKYI